MAVIEVAMVAVSMIMGVVVVMAAVEMHVIGSTCQASVK